MPTAETLLLQLVFTLLREISPEVKGILYQAMIDIADIAARGGSEGDSLIAALLSNLVAQITDSQKE